MRHESVTYDSHEGIVVMLSHDGIVVMLSNLDSRETMGCCYRLYGEIY